MHLERPDRIPSTATLAIGAIAAMLGNTINPFQC
jgi:hypothetical protein